MKARTMGRLQRQPTPHTAWCARDHRCGVDQHRSPDLIADAIGGRAVITRVRAGDVEYVEIRARVPLHRNEKARWQGATTLHRMRELLAAVVVRLPPVESRGRRQAIDQRAA